MSLSYEEYKNMKSRINWQVLAEAEDDVKIVVLRRSVRPLMIYVLCQGLSLIQYCSY